MASASAKLQRKASSDLPIVITIIKNLEERERETRAQQAEEKFNLVNHTPRHTDQENRRAKGIQTKEMASRK